MFPPDDLSSGPYTQSIIRFFFLVYQADVSIFYTSNLYWWGKGWPVDGLPFPDTGCPVPDVSIYYMSNINELPDGILFHWFCKCTPPWMFLPLDIPSEYRPEHVTFGLLCVIFKFPSRIFCRRVPGFATDCPCGVWCRGLTTWYFVFLYLIFLSQQVLYFLLSTLVLTLYIDVVLSLSIGKESRTLDVQEVHFAVNGYTVW